MEITKISLEGLLTVGGNEDRALAYIDVHYNEQIYKWTIFVPQNISSLEEFLEESKSRVKAQIDAKEAQWAALDPKTREIPDKMGGSSTIVPIEKEEIVRPDNPDYYALRRSEYPPIGEQLGAFWKGPDHPEYQAMAAKIEAIKQKYPKS